jgi:hypothetical protein
MKTTAVRPATCEEGRTAVFVRPGGRRGIGMDRTNVITDFNANYGEDLAARDADDVRPERIASVVPSADKVLQLAGGYRIEVRDPRQLVEHPLHKTIIGSHEMSTNGMVTELDGSKGFIVPKPVVVCADGVTVIDGHKEWRRSLDANLGDIPVLVLNPLDAASEERLMIELNVVGRRYTEGRAVQLLIRHSETLGRRTAPRGKTRDRIAKVLGIAPRTVQDAITVLRAFEKGDLPIGHLYVLGMIRVNVAVRALKARVAAKTQHEIVSAVVDAKTPDDEKSEFARKLVDRAITSSHMTIADDNPTMVETGEDKPEAADTAPGIARDATSPGHAIDPLSDDTDEPFVNAASKLEAALLPYSDPLRLAYIGIGLRVLKSRGEVDRISAIEDTLAKILMTISDARAEDESEVDDDVA